MTLREKIGQMIMAGVPDKQLEGITEQYIKEYKVGNIILFDRNVKNKQQVRELCADLQVCIRKETGLPPFIAVDQEGGIVSRFPKEAVLIPSAMAVSATGREENAYICGKITAFECLDMGINFNLAPVLDINCNRKNPVIGIRSYGDNADIVTRFGVAMIKGLQEHHVLASAKHFPGHGDTEVDSHLGLPVVYKTWEELKNFEIIPFQEAFKNGVGCITTSHILFPNIEKENKPATMSKTILTDLLRKELGYDGLILTDCMEMAAIHDYYGTAKGSVEAIKAGATIVCISHTWELVVEAIEAIEEAVIAGEIPMSLIDEAVERIKKYKSNIKQNSILRILNQKGAILHKENNSLSSNNENASFRSNNENASLRSNKENDSFILNNENYKIKEVDEYELLKKQVENIRNVGIVKLGKGELPNIDCNTCFIGSNTYRVTLATSDEEKKQSFCEYMAEYFEGRSFIATINPSQEDINKYVEAVKEHTTIVYGTFHGIRNEGQIVLANKLIDEGHMVIAVALYNPYELEYISDQAHKIATFGNDEGTYQSLAKLLAKEIPFHGRLPISF